MNCIYSFDMLYVGIPPKSLSLYWVCRQMVHLVRLVFATDYYYAARESTCLQQIT